MDEQTFEFTERPGEPLTLEGAVFEALGAASMCWTEPPAGVFDSTRAMVVGNALVERIRRGDPRMTVEEIPAAPEPAKLTAIRWLRNGDHPADGDTYPRLEGAVVRFFRHPDFPGDQKHNGPGGCWERWHDHGWIDDVPAGITVCPGDLVVDLPDGGHEVLKLGRGAHRDRNDHYVPAGLSLDGKPQFVEVSEPRELNPQWAMDMLESAARLLLQVRHGGPDVPPELPAQIGHWLGEHDPEGFKGWSGLPRPARTARLAMAMPDELNRDQNHWWWADLSADGEDAGTHWSVFRGHRVQVDVELHTSNRREVNDWKGRDEIRAGGEWSIKLNRQQVYDGYIGLDVPATLRKIADKVEALIGDNTGGGCPGFDLADPTPFEEQLTGRRVYYRDTPAVVSSASVLHQGCVMLKPVGGFSAFPRQGYDLDREPDGTGHGEQDSYDEFEAREVKVEIDSPHIWWWRDRPYSADETDGRYRPRRNREAKMEAKEQGEPQEAPEFNPASGNPVPEDMRPGQKSPWKPLTAGGSMYVAPLGTEVPDVVFQPLPPVDDEQAGQARESVPVEAGDDEGDDS